MTIRVVLPRQRRRRQRFTLRLSEALASICPCYEYLIVDGIVRLFPFEPKSTFCFCYCDRRAGCNLIRTLIESRMTISIGRGPNQYNPATNAVTWSPSARPRVRTRTDRGPRNLPTPACKTLGHELIHALHDLQNRLAAQRLTEEFNTVRGENQLRAEQNLGARLRYGRGRRRDVPNPDGGNIDGTDRENCDCDRRVALKDDCALRGEFDQGFADTGGGEAVALEDTLEQTIAAAASIRKQSRPKTLSEAWSKLARARFAVLLESVNENADSYTFVLLHAQRGGLKMITNLGARLVAGDVDAVVLNTLCQQRIALEGKAAKRWQALHDSEAEGVGGDPAVFDGSTDFLTLVRNGKPTELALYGALYRPLADTPYRPKGRGNPRRYRAIREVYRLWAEAVTAKGKKSRPLK